MINYAEDTSYWENWQRDYRLGLILIMTPIEVSKQIDPLRSKYDPRAFGYCPTHITVSDPLRYEMAPEAEEEVRGILSTIEPFVLHYDKPHASPDYPGIAYPIMPQEPIDNLKQALHSASVFAGAVFRRRHIPAHMTIAEFITIEDGLKLCAELQDSVPSGSFLCDRLEFIVPDKNFCFRREGIFFLGDSKTRGV
jgi:2'-5' RNA ligase